MHSKTKNKKSLLFKALFLAVLGVLVYQSYSYWPAVLTSVGVMQKEMPIYCVQTDKKQVALSFDSAMDNEDTSQILSILEKYNIKATFFVTGSWVDSFPEETKAIAAAGHDLGNHSESHVEMSQLSAEEIKQELSPVYEKTKNLTGVELTLFRPPYGDYDDELVTTVTALGYYCIEWDVDSLDWKDYGTESIIKTVCNHKNLGNGSIILMHNGATYTADALESVISGLQNQGYEFVPISQLLHTGDYTMDQTGRQIPN